MAPISADKKDLPGSSKIISHQHNSHTIKPKIPCEPKYPYDFYEMNGTHLIDFPGMFESKGAELDIAMHLTLKKVLTTAKSAKILLLVQATCLIPENNHIIATIREKLQQMFKDPEQHIVIGITKNRMVQ